MSYPATTADDFDRPRMTPAVQWLIAINVAVYFFQVMLYSDPQGGVGLADVLGFQMQDLSQVKYWWKMVTYMFVHANVYHLFGNMYMLWLFGTRLEHHWTPAAFARYYILCGLGAWLAQVLLFHSGVLIGASGAVYGVMLAYALNWPNEELLLFWVAPVRVKWVVVGYVLYDLTFGFLQLTGGAQSNVAHFAHLGGLATGFLVLSAPSGRRLERVRQRVATVPDTGDEIGPRPVPRALPRPPREPEVDDVVARSKAAVARRPAPPPAPRPPVALPPASATATRGSDLDVVLDKISEFGIESLTSDERLLLEEASRKLRETT